MIPPDEAGAIFCVLAEWAPVDIRTSRDIELIERR
jgi:hypothetical protein